MVRTTENTKKAPPLGAYLVDERMARQRPPSAPWVGRVQAPLDGGAALVTSTGYEWCARPGDAREATSAVRAAFDAARHAWLRTPIPGVRS